MLTSSGMIIPFISERYLLEIEILVPQTLDTQKVLFENDKYNYSLSKAKEYGLEKLLQKQKNDYLEEIRIKKHNLAQYLAEFNSSVSVLSKYVNSKGLGSEVISKKSNTTLSSHISRLSFSIDAMNRKLELLTKSSNFGEAENVDINKFLKRIKGTNDYSVEYTFDTEFSQSKVAYTYINKEDLNEVIQQIISNAVKHGFVKNNVDNIIRFNLTFDIDSDMYVIEISNNGKPMPKGMNSKRYGIKGEVAGITGNEGIGGYRVKSIIEHFKGIYSVENDVNSLFPVQITIKLPKNN